MHAEQLVSQIYETTQMYENVTNQQKSAKHRKQIVGRMTEGLFPKHVVCVLVLVYKSDVFSMFF